MPNRNDIYAEIAVTSTPQDTVRRKYIKELSDYTKRDTVVYSTAFTVQKTGVPSDSLSITHQDIGGFMSSLYGLKNDKLDLILHSPGGSGDAAEQIVTYLRSKYKHIRAIIPQNAMSAATMISCACDSLVMGKHSAIGPIDPQMMFQVPNGIMHVTSAQSVLDEFEMAKEQIKNDPSTIPLWITKIQNYPPGFLTSCKTAIESCTTRVASWLKEYMLDGNSEKANEISEWLGSESEHKAHGRPIAREIARSKGMVIEDLESDQKLQEAVLSIFHSTMITFELTNCVKLIENQNGIGSFSIFQPQIMQR